MARYTGPSWKISRRLGISLSGTGKELEKRPLRPYHMVQDNAKNYLNTVYNYKRSKSFVTCTVSTNVNSVHYLTELLNFLRTR